MSKLLIGITLTKLHTTDTTSAETLKKDNPDLYAKIKELIEKTLDNKE